MPQQRPPAGRRPVQTPRRRPANTSHTRSATAPSGAKKSAPPRRRKKSRRHIPRWLKLLIAIILLPPVCCVLVNLFILATTTGNMATPDELADADADCIVVLGAGIEPDGTPSPILALIPLVPITILVVGNLWCPFIKMGVAQAMVLGAVIALVVARANPQTFTKEFFAGTGKGYADVMGIIIAAGVFAAGLKSAGLIDTFVAALKESNDIARWGGSIGPFIMGVITGSGDAATLAFNETVTPHAKDFGMTIEGLGGLAFLAGAAGRTASPLAGVTILVSGIAMVSPIEVVKRTAIPMIAATIVCALIMV